MVDRGQANMSGLFSTTTVAILFCTSWASWGPTTWTVPTKKWWWEWPQYEAGQYRQDCSVLKEEISVWYGYTKENLATLTLPFFWSNIFSWFSLRSEWGKKWFSRGRGRMFYLSLLRYKKKNVHVNLKAQNKAIDLFFFFFYDHNWCYKMSLSCLCLAL